MIFPKLRRAGDDRAAATLVGIEGADMTTTMDLWLAWMRGWMAAANAFAQAQHAAVKELAPLLERQPQAALAAMERAAAEPARAARAAASTGAMRAEADALGAAAGNKPSPRPRGRPRRQAK
jgi:hypothetical protein